MDFNDHTPFPPVLPSRAALASTRDKIHTTLPPTPLGTTAAITHLHELKAGMDSAPTSPYYYGFVTGGALPASLAADKLVSEWDQNLHSHLPEERVATDVEAAALEMLKELLRLDGEWKHGVFTTGATAANIVGLATGREAIVQRAGGGSVARSGLVRALRQAGKEGVQVLSACAHSSLRKAAAVVGIGHEEVVDVGKQGEEWRIDFAKLEERLRDEKVLSIVSVSCAEVQTGLFATTGLEEMKKIRELADRHGAWVHVDAAFGLLARILPDGEEFAALKKGTEGIELADSIAGDAHKLFNVPYDCGILFSRHLETAFQTFQNPGAPYLDTAPAAIPSPLNIGIENSRRFRALPVYANLIAYGKEGYQQMLVRQVRLARGVADWLRESKDYELLPLGISTNEVYIIVLFRAKDEAKNKIIRSKISEQRKIYCSPTAWEGKPAVRLAVSNWLADPERDLPVVQDALMTALDA